jgi:anti-sigma factor RsiW
MMCSPEQLSALLDGDLSARQATKVRAHLSGCAACQRAYDELTALRAALRAEPSSEIEAEPRDRFAELMATVPRPREPSRRWRWVWAPSFALACAVVALYVHHRPRSPGVSDDAIVAQAEAEFRRADVQYRDAIAKLRSVSSQGPRDVRVAAAETQLQAAVDECRRTAEARPSDADAEQLLFAAYRKQIDFYERMVLEAHR